MTFRSSQSTLQPARPANLRVQNSRTLLRLVRSHEPCSRADLARLSGLSAPTVTAAIADLEVMGLIENAGEGPSSGGRPPELLRFRPGHRYVAAVDIGGTRLRLMIADLNGAPVTESKCVIPANAKDPESICTLLHTELLSACATAGIAYNKILHLTVGAPGITDVDLGVVLSAPNLTRWSNVPLRQMLEEQCGIEATVENDVNLAAVGEHWRGAAVGIDNFLLIALGTGIGAGIYVNGRLFRGARWSAGEMGYLPVLGMERELPDIDAPGQLERIIGGGGIEHTWRKRIAESGRSSQADLLALRANQILDRAEGVQDPDAVAILNQTAQLLSDAIISSMLLLNPGMVVLGGGVGCHRSLQQAVEAHLEKVRFPRPIVCTSLLDTHAQLYGAIALSLEASQTELIC